MSVKVALRTAIARALYSSGITAPRRQGRGRLSIVTFHRVLPEAERQAYPYPDLVVTPEELDALLAYFTEHFDCGTLARQHERFAARETPPRPLLAVTFDDGQYDNFRHARPVLARYGVKASFFIPVEAVERGELLWHDRLGFAVQSLFGDATAGPEAVRGILRAYGLALHGPVVNAGKVAQAAKSLPAPSRLKLTEALSQAAASDKAPEFARLMTFAEIGKLAAEGHEIGSHSMSHRMMPECDDSALEYEVAESRRVLRARLGLSVESFCYPNGDCDARSARAVAGAGYRRAVTTAAGRNEVGADPFQLHRHHLDAARLRNSRGYITFPLVAYRLSIPLWGA